MKIVDYDDLPRGAQAEVQLLDATTGWYPMDPGRLTRARKLGYPATDYFGVYAVKGNEVRSVVRVIRVPYTMADGGVETVSGVQGVVTRPERSGRGLARMLLEEVHEREAAAGNRFVLLWTGRALMAHNLYESLGYSDVHTPSIAVGKFAKKRPPRGYEVRKGKKEDARSIHDMHARATAGRTGFTPRPKGMLPALFEVGLAKPDAFRLMFHRDEPVGYAQWDLGTGWAKSMEVVLTEGIDAGTALSLLESEASGDWLTLTGTFVSDQHRTLARRGYALTGSSYSVLLARPLKSKGRSELTELGTRAPSFTCHFLDNF